MNFSFPDLSEKLGQKWIEWENHKLDILPTATSTFVCWVSNILHTKNNYEQHHGADSAQSIVLF